MEQTINDVFYNRTRKYGERIAIEKKRNGKWESVSWNTYYDRARAVGLWLTRTGVTKGDHVAILSENRLEWLYADMGTLGIGCCVVPIYTTQTGEDIKYIVNHSDSRVLFLEDSEQLAKIAALLDDMPGLIRIVVFDTGDNGMKDSRIRGFNEVLAAGKAENEKDPASFQRHSRQVKPTDLATIVYTSGTTGVPKGVMITHGNIMAVINSLEQVRPKYAGEDDCTVPFLPLSHVFERIAGHFFGMYVGITASYAESILTFAEDVKEKRPTMILAVPRVCEKVYQKIKLTAENQPAWKQAIFAWGLKVGFQISELREKKAPVPLHLKIRYGIAYRLVFKKLAEALGGRVRWMTAAGAPTSRDIVLFFNAAGITVVEGYGLTETCAPVTMSNLADYRIGTVGNPIPDASIKLDEDGEILVKGNNVFKGYYKMAAETRAAFTEDGYFRTGDIGEFKDNFLSITDRKKDLIITSGGKNVSPQKIEGLFMSDPLFSHFLVVGERRKFLSALLCINPDYAEIVAEQNGIAFSGMNDLLQNESFLNVLDDRVKKKNMSLARYETIKKYRIIDREFSSEGGELTVSMKMKRNVILKKYAPLIEEMYA